MLVKKLIIGACLLGGIMPAQAEQLTPEQALERARLTAGTELSLVQRMPMLRDLSAMKLVHTQRFEQLNTFYVFDQSHGGFMIIAADDAVADPILAYSDNANFDPENIPADMQWFLQGYSYRVAEAAAGKSVAAGTPLSLAAATRRDVAPLCKTKWDQGSPYWNDCPVISGQNCNTGCGATALAQIMKVHNWPESGEGINSYRLSGYGMITVDFSKSVYDWDNMLDTYTSSASAEQKAAVAKLMYDCGVAMNMQYSPNMSGAIVTDIAEGLVSYFKYANTVRPINRDSYYYEEFVDILYNELINGRPVLLGGSNYYQGSYYGHAFVLDGYRADGDYFHINWGWSGMSDGYFKITALDPESQGAGGSMAGYNLSSIAVVGIQPDRGEEFAVEPNLFANTAFVTPASSYSRTETVKFFNGGRGFGVFNYTPKPASVIVYPAVKLIDEESGEETIVATQTPHMMSFATGFASYEIAGSLFPSDGNYQVTPGFLYENKWFDIHVDISANRELRLEASRPTLNFTPSTELASVAISNFEVPEKVYLNAPFRVKADLTAEGGEFFTRLKLSLLQKNAAVELAVLDLRQIDLLDGESETIEWTPALSDKNLTPGEYRLAISKTTVSGQSTMLAGGVIAINIEAAQSPTVTVTNVTLPGASGAGTSSFMPATISLDNFRADVTMAVTGGYYSDLVGGVVFNRTGANYLADIPGKFIEINDGSKGVVSLSANFVNVLKTNTVYMFVPFGTYAGQLGDGNTFRFFKATVAGIEEVSDDEAAQVTVGPNPVVAEFTVSAPVEIKTVDVLGINGSKVASVKGESTEATVDMSAAVAGHYIVRIMLADGTIVNRQIIKR